MRSGNGVLPFSAQDRLDLSAPQGLERAARDYLRWAGRPDDEENLTHATSRIRDLNPGRAVAREDLHVQLVMEELVSGLALRPRRVA